MPRASWWPSGFHRGSYRFLGNSFLCRWRCVIWACDAVIKIFGQKRTLKGFTGSKQSVVILPSNFHSDQIQWSAAQNRRLINNLFLLGLLAERWQAPAILQQFWVQLWSVKLVGSLPAPRMRIGSFNKGGHPYYLFCFCWGGDLASFLSGQWNKQIRFPAKSWIMIQDTQWAEALWVERPAKLEKQRYDQRHHESINILQTHSLQFSCHSKLPLRISEIISFCSIAASCLISPELTVPYISLELELNCLWCGSSGSRLLRLVLR